MLFLLLIFLLLIHDRMPVILPGVDIEKWINPDSKPDEIIKNAHNNPNNIVEEMPEQSHSEAITLRLF